MISANDLDALLEVVKKHSVNVFRYKAGQGDSGEEIEIVIPTGADSKLENINESTTDMPRIKLMGFHGDDDE